MEILSINFAIFVVQLAFCIVPIAIGIRLFTLSAEFNEETRQMISKKLLKDLITTQSFYNLVLYFVAVGSILLGLLVSLFVIFVIL